ncbi:DUF1482 family protein [Escherichia coli]|nr:DUF1482 family protein [Escherichia coli]EFG0059227.1 DUF1482 family protein [Escherichia coli]EFK3215034.1 DUF1482 family protein [Escherichia coli]
MFALVLFICYLDGGCFPIEDFIDGFWRPAQEYGDF